MFLQSNFVEMLNVLEKLKPYYVRCLKVRRKSIRGYLIRNMGYTFFRECIMSIFETVDLVESSKPDDMVTAQKLHL